jgi:hypothetical protein
MDVFSHKIHVVYDCFVVDKDMMKYNDQAVGLKVLY